MMYVEANLQNTLHTYNSLSGDGIQSNYGQGCQLTGTLACLGLHGS